MNNTIGAETKVYKNVETNLNLKDTDLTKYIFLTGLIDQKDAKLLVGLQNSIINFGNSPSHHSNRNIR